MSEDQNDDNALIDRAVAAAMECLEQEADGDGGRVGALWRRRLIRELAWQFGDDDARQVNAGLAEWAAPWRLVRLSEIAPLPRLDAGR
jgi:hypothetical protein